MYDVTMPKLSDSMEVGKIIRWRVQKGAQVRGGDVLAEVESDKAVMELECFRDGIMAEVLHGDGAEVKVGDVIARIASKSEKPADMKAPPPVSAPTAAPEPKPSAPAAPAPSPSVPVPARAVAGRVRISPYARKLAEMKGMDYSALHGSGPGGRIMARDIEQAASGAPAVPPPKAAPVAPAGGIISSVEEELPAVEVTDEEAIVEDAPFRLKTQARRLIASNHSIPHFFITRGVEVTDLLRRKDVIRKEHGATLTHLIMRACVFALQEHPAINWSYDRGRIIKWKGIHLGLAVDTDAGLTVAVLRGAQGLSLRDLVQKTQALIERARAGALSAAERIHATFTITNLGMFDVEHFAPIINPPSSVTLAVSSALPSTVVTDEAIRIGRVMRLTAACDHRIVDGAGAARFMKTLSDILATPDRLLAG